MYRTFCEIGGHEFDVEVDADYWPAEPDVGADAGYSLNAVYYRGVDLIERMSEYELDQLALRIGKIVNEPPEEYEP